MYIHIIYFHIYVHIYKCVDGAPKPKELVAPKPKSWFVRQKVLGANIHETEGLLERSIAKTRSICEKKSFVYFRRWGNKSIHQGSKIETAGKL